MHEVSLYLLKSSCEQCQCMEMYTICVYTPLCMVVCVGVWVSVCVVGVWCVLDLVCVGFGVWCVLDLVCGVLDLVCGVCWIWYVVCVGFGMWCVCDVCMGCVCGVCVMCAWGVCVVCVMSDDEAMPTLFTARTKGVDSCLTVTGVLGNRL